MILSGRQYGWVCLALLGLEATSVLGYAVPGLRGPILLIVAVGVGWLSWRRPWVVALMGLAELLVGGKGQLLFVTLGGFTISLRYVLFGTLLLMAIRNWNHLYQGMKDRPTGWRWPIALGLWVIIAIIWGLVQGYPISRVFTDGNAYVMLAVVPLWSLFVVAQQRWREWVVTILLAGLTIVGLKGMILESIFGRDPAWLLSVYHWVRATGVGEIAPITGNVYRVFMQSQVYSVLALLVVAALMLKERLPRWTLWPLAAGCTAFLMSLSRTFWLGAAVGIICLLLLLLLERQWRVLKMWWPIVPLSIVIGFVAFSWSVNFPYPWPTGDRPASVFQARLTEGGSGDASAARRNQVAPLWHEISQNPIFGRGVGAQATFYNPDPRIRGWRTTSAFELGYFDWWLKFGLIGLVLLMAWLWRIVRSAWSSPWRWAIISSTAALAAIHITSPYLNHPLGIGWLAILTLLTYDHD